MKKILPYILILSILVGVFSPVFSVGAKVGSPPPCDAGESVVNDMTNPNVQTCAIGSSSAQAQQEIINATAGGDGLDWIAGWVATALGYLAFLIMKIMALLLGMAGVLLNFVIKTTVVDMAGNISHMTGINVAWKVLRDLMNIAFIFLLVYEGVLMIIGQSDVGKVKNFITFLVLASLLINFSLFFTKVIIDASNVVTIGVYNSILVTTDSADSSMGLSNSYMSSLGLQGVMSPLGGFTGFSQVQNGPNGDDYSMLVIGLMTSILFLITTFVFLAISVMFIVRYIVLIILLTLSPVAYMGMALPKIAKKYADEWWETLWGQVIFAPVFMLMTWVVLTLMNSPGFSGFVLDPNKWTDFSKAKDITTMSGSISLFFNYALVIGLTIATLTTAKKFSTQGSSQIGKFTSSATSFAGGVAMGGLGWAGRRSIGRVADRLTRSEKFQEYAGKNVVVRQLYKGTQATAGSTFDARNSGIVKQAVGSLPVDFGKGSNSTFGKTMEAQTKSKIDFGKSLDRSKTGKEAYIKGLAGASGLSRLYIKGGSNNSFRSLAGTLGRDDRLAAASLLKDRIKEATTELGGLRSEQNILTKAYNESRAAGGTGPNLTPIEDARRLQLTATGPAGSPPPGSLQEKSEEITDLKTQATSLELDKTQRQKY
ncbi:MAG: hypothetical protein ABL899_01710 [Nitrospira sp.]